MWHGGFSFGPIAVAGAPLPALRVASGGGARAGDAAWVILYLAVILAGAWLGGRAAARFGQPRVLGELAAGLFLGNLPLAGIHGLEGLAADRTVGDLAALGVLVLLFEVGLASTVRDMLRVALSAFLVAALGVAASFALGWSAARWLLPSAGPYTHVFLGAMLTATSVGISARVLRDLGRSNAPEARIILGAAVVDDLLSLLVLAVVSGAAVAAGTATSPSAGAVSQIFAKALLFLASSLAIGAAMPRGLARAVRRLGSHALLALGLALCFFLSWLAGLAGLAPLVGAFAAGVLLVEEAASDGSAGPASPGLAELVRPVSSFLAPVFFVSLGASTSLAALASPEALGLAGALTAAAVLGKQACAAGVLAKRVDRFTVALGMIPRGEVQLVYANAGLGLAVAGRPVLTPAAHAAAVVVVLATTLVAAPALRWRIARVRRGFGAEGAP
ncbi:MAG TPA: cation:proton antiporter [Anaeromyxobacteraceae bacterium]|nr:cation:proton antiporter [Anaeromyxobacteraceae bacterium]